VFQHFYSVFNIVLAIGVYCYKIFYGRIKQSEVDTSLGSRAGAKVDAVFQQCSPSFLYLFV
jgi:hypothetical protein